MDSINIHRLPSTEGICCFSTDASSDETEFLNHLSRNHHPIMPIQTHSVNVALVENTRNKYADTDALITQITGLPIGIRTADCVPVILHATDIKAIAAVHAGWKGTLGGIIDNTIDKLLELGAHTENIYATFGVSICKNCYEVDKELAEQFVLKGFNSYVSYPNGKSSKPHIDLQGINAKRMVNKGILENHITLNNNCTRCTCDASGKHVFNSWRRTPGTKSRNLTIAMILLSEQRSIRSS